MGKEYTEIDVHVRAWIERQQMFFVSTAPLANDGLVNCSPKGLDGLRVLGPRRLAYIDLGGSGIETVAHLKENGRIVIMLCAFEGPPKVFRFYGQGRVVERHDAEFQELTPLFPDLPPARDFVLIDVQRIRDSCGYGVPLYDFRGERDSLPNWIENKTEDELVAYRKEFNARSLDGLDGLDPRSLTSSEKQ